MKTYGNVDKGQVHIKSTAQLISLDGIVKTYSTSLNQDVWLHRSCDNGESVVLVKYFNEDNTILEVWLHRVYLNYECVRRQREECLDLGIEFQLLSLSLSRTLNSVSSPYDCFFLSNSRTVLSALRRDHSYSGYELKILSMGNINFIIKNSVRTQISYYLIVRYLIFTVRKLNFSLLF